MSLWIYWVLTRDEMRELMRSLDAELFRADQILNWLYDRQVTDIGEMRNLPDGLRRALTERGWRAQALAVALTRSAGDGTERYLFALADGESVEGVYLPEKKRQTVCLSSQVGCAMNCRFCATGQTGFVRNLSAGEMVDAVRQIGRRKQKRISHVVVMGQGEPLANYDNLLKALEILKAPYGLNISARHISISTAGLVPQILALAKKGFQYNLAVSLHATNDELRSSLMPVNRAYPLGDLHDACREYASATGRRVTLEYIMIRGINDSRKDLEGLIAFAKGWLSHVNLIPFHSVPGSQWTASTRATIERFLDDLQRAGIPATLRRSRGEEVLAACGQLRQETIMSNKH